MEIEEILKGIQKINEARKHIAVIYSVDEQDRIVKFQVLNQEYGNGAEKSHTFSYLYSRKMLQEEGEIMGFDQELIGTEK